MADYMAGNKLCAYFKLESICLLLLCCNKVYKEMNEAAQENVIRDYRDTDD